MPELYENPAYSSRMMKRLLNSNVRLNDIDLSSIQIKLCNLIEHGISREHVKTAINTWTYYQGLINMSSRTDLKNIKQKINKLITIRDEILLKLFDHDINIFEQSGRVFSIFGVRDNIVEFAQGLNRKNGSPYSKTTLKKQCYFELLFTAESLGLAGPVQYYQSSDLKSFLEIITEPLIEETEAKETLWYYCQEYEKAKNHSDIKGKIIALTKHCVEYRFNVPIWKKLLTIYQDQIAPLMLTH